MPFTTRFDDELNPASVALAWQIWKDKSIADPAAAGVAVLNVESFVLGKMLGQPKTERATGVTVHTDADIDAAFGHALAVAEGKKLGAEAIGDGKWLKVLAAVLKIILPLILES